MGNTNIPVTKIHSYNVSVAADVGINAAVLFYNICYWVEENTANDRNCVNGEYWTYNTVNAFKTLFPEMSYEQVRNALRKLENKGYIKSDFLNDDTRDRTKWYTVCDTNKWIISNKCNCENSQMENEKNTDDNNIYNNKNTDTDNKQADNNIADNSHKNSTSNDVDTLNSPFRQMETSAHKERKADEAKKDMAVKESLIPITASQITYRIYQDYIIANNVSNFIEYFLKKRKEKTNKEHVPLKESTLQRIISVITEGNERYYEGKDYYTIFEPLIPSWEDESYKKIVDVYFEQKFKMKVDYSLPHFAQINVLSTLMMKVEKDYWCRNENCGFMED